MLILFGIIDHLRSSAPSRNKKPNFTCCDLNDVTLGSSAILFVQKSKERAEKTSRTSQKKLSETRGFPSPPYDGFGFSSIRFEISRQNAKRSIRSKACTFW